MGTPAIFGMNFQTVSTAEKLPTSDGLKGGYLPDGVSPGPLLARALEYINTKVGAMVEAVEHRHLDRSTVIILSAKHGQSPQTPSALTRIPDGPIVSALNAAWKAAHPTGNADLVAFSTNDDGMLIWLSDRQEFPAQQLGNRQRRRRQAEGLHGLRPEDRARGCRRGQVLPRRGW